MTARINYTLSSGNILMGNVTTSSLNLAGSVGLSGQYKTWVQSTDAFNTKYPLLYDYYDPTYWESVRLDGPAGPAAAIGLYKNGGLIVRTGNVSTFNTVSDQNMKTDIQVVDYDRCFEIVNTIDLKRFKFDKEKLPESQKDMMGDDTYRYGFIAQEVKEVFPKSVTGTDVLNVNVDQMNYALYGATKKLISIINELKTQELERQLQQEKQTQELDSQLQEARQTIQKLVNYIKQKNPGDLDEFDL
jgi:CHAT domain-containing protein